jgi:hypothetical protein
MARNLPKVRQVKLGKKQIFKVVEQPAGRKSFVSEEKDALTAFKIPIKNGIYGFLAHNFLAGKYFFDLKVGSPLEITDQDGKEKKYIVSKIQKFQAKNPGNPRSDFIDLEKKQTISATDLFNQMYQGTHRLVLQTCISKGDDQEWGRCFLIAEPVKDLKNAQGRKRYRKQPL